MCQDVSQVFMDVVVAKKSKSKKGRRIKKKTYQGSLRRVSKTHFKPFMVVVEREEREGGKKCS